MAKKKLKCNSFAKQKESKKTQIKPRKETKKAKKTRSAVKPASKATNISNINTEKQGVGRAEEDFKYLLEGIELERNINNNKKKRN